VLGVKLRSGDIGVDDSVGSGDVLAAFADRVDPGSSVVRISMASGVVVRLALSLADVVGIEVSEETTLETENVESWDIDVTAAQVDGWILGGFACGWPPSPPLEVPCEVGLVATIAFRSLETRRPS
jgi:hypothetical protein